jgi:hypothetical protein
MDKRIQLGCVDKPGGTSIWYVLLLSTDGGMTVEETYDYDQPYKKDRVNIIEQANWHKYEVNGIPLVLLIERKMSEVPPTSN